MPPFQFLNLHTSAHSAFSAVKHQIGFVFSPAFWQYASRSTQYEIDWLCFFRCTRSHEAAEHVSILAEGHEVNDPKSESWDLRSNNASLR
jgi:hypothetical protein